MQTRPTLIEENGKQAQMLGDVIFRGAPVVVDVAHHEIHCGDSYESSYTGDLGNGASVVFSVVVPNTGLSQTFPGSDQVSKQYHAKFAIDTEAEALVTIHEGATLSNNGTPVTIFNRNRNATYTDYLGWNITPTITGAGNVIYTKRIGSGKTSGGNAGRENELILKNNTKYTITITNATTSDNYYNIELDYYVHPGI